MHHPAQAQVGDRFLRFLRGLGTPDEDQPTGPMIHQPAGQLQPEPVGSLGLDLVVAVLLSACFDQFQHGGGVAGLVLGAVVLDLGVGVQHVGADLAAPGDLFLPCLDVAALGLALAGYNWIGGLLQAAVEAEVPFELFLNDVLPYAVLDETREDWRPAMLERARRRVSRRPDRASQT